MTYLTILVIQASLQAPILCFLFKDVIAFYLISLGAAVTNATRPLSRCYLRSYLVKNTAGAQKEPSKKYKNNTKDEATSNAELNTSITRI